MTTRSRPAMAHAGPVAVAVNAENTTPGGKSTDAPLARRQSTLLRRSHDLLCEAWGNEMAKRILIIEDDPDNLETLGLLFTTWGYEVLLAETGEMGIALATTTLPDIVLLDLGLPGIVGEEVARILKMGMVTPFIIAYTGYERLEQAALAAGCDAFLVKPNLDRLAALLVSLDVGDMVMRKQ
jgi:CheY-like chemotaxis protein